MIAIFTVLGFVLFGSGAYAIYDGWPYLVLERGFTQVIIGSIASSVGLILLALAWVLREIGALRRSLAEGVPVRAEAQAATDSVRAPWEAAREERLAKSSAIAPAVIGAAAGAATAGAVADALVAPARETPPASETVPKPDRDLFGTLVAQRLEDTEPQQNDEPDVPPPENAEPLPDMFAEDFVEKVDEAREAPVAVETESHEPAEIVAAKIQPVAEDDALAHAAEPVVHPETAPEQEELIQAGHDESKPVDIDDGFDEFSALRESLAGHLNEPIPSGTRTEPSLAPEADPFAAAEAWMDKASPRKEPWFESPAATGTAETEAAPPPWPPRTETPEFSTPSAPAAPETEEAPEAAAAEPDETAPGEGDQSATATDAIPAGDAPEEDQEASPERATSDEGIVGAYQVGDAHFTIYADGSIRARTPDGEYSFASMDELKVYLASEKSRLGM